MASNSPKDGQWFAIPVEITPGDEFTRPFVHLHERNRCYLGVRRVRWSHPILRFRHNRFLGNNMTEIRTLNHHNLGWYIETQHGICVGGVAAADVDSGSCRMHPSYRWQLYPDWSALATQVHLRRSAA